MNAKNPAPAYQHAPVLGLTHRLLGRFHVTGVFWYQFPYWAFTRLPFWMQWIGVTLFTAVFFVALTRIRSAIASNLEPVLGRANRLTRWGRAYRTMHAFAWCLNERYRRLAEPERFRAVLDGEEYWRQADVAGRGIVVVTAHIGPWETGAQLGGDAARRRMHVVREKEIDPRAQAFMEQILAAAGHNHITHFAGEDLRLSLELGEALRKGEIVALQGDRPRAGSKTISVTLFGRPMPLPVGPALLARAVGVPLVPVFNFREGRCLLRTVIRPPITVARSGNRERDIADAMQRLAAEVEWAINQRPHQWFCFRELWNSAADHQSTRA
jgi:lauroyl/myristoyl acyltransferase